MESGNKRVRNATKTGKFKSKLEGMIDMVLREHGFDPLYEEVTFTLVEGFRPTAKYYTKDKASRGIKLDKYKIRDLTYTPDFTFQHAGKQIVIEVKGYQNDRFPIKKKLFRQFIEKEPDKYLVFEVYTKKQLLEAISIIKDSDGS